MNWPSPICVHLPLRTNQGTGYTKPGDHDGENTGPERAVTTSPGICALNTNITRQVRVRYRLVVIILVPDLLEVLPNGVVSTGKSPSASFAKDDCRM